MAMEVAPLERPGLKLMTDVVPEKAVKRRKSFGRSLSSAFKKSSRSSATSPSSEDIHVPPTPHIPDGLRPRASTSQSFPRSPSSQCDTDLIDKRDREEKVTKGLIELGMVMEEPKRRSGHLKKERSVYNSSLRHARQKSWFGGDDSQRPQTAGVDKSGADQVHDDASSSLARTELAKGCLRVTTNNPQPSPKNRFAEVAPKNKSSPASPQLSRPATSSGSPRSPGFGPRLRLRGSSSPLQQHGPFTSSEVPELPVSPHRPRFSPAEVRTSFRSALTSTTSRTNGTTTNRSSILTKDTAFTDVTTEIPPDPPSKAASIAERSMTVDEAIDMYAAGFTDDPEEDLEQSRDTSLSDEERRRSTKIAEAISDNMGSPKSARPSLGASLSSRRPSTTASSSSVPFSTREPMPQRPLTSGSVSCAASRDQYGFLKTNINISQSDYDLWNAEYSPLQERRNEKWAMYMREQGLSTDSPSKFPSRSTKTQRYIRKGIPPACRGEAWFFYAGGDAYLSRHPQLYNNLVHLEEAKLSADEKELIERDLHRTFPDNIRFKPDSQGVDGNETTLLTSLRRVLRAFALHSPKIGYCQSLNFIAGLLLLFLPEEKTFWMLHIITVLYLPGTHDVSLEGANIDLWVLMVALKNTMPQVWGRVGTVGMTDEEGKKSKLPPISLCTTGWFMALFIGTLPIETVLRVWDVLFYEGSRTLFRVALTIFKIGEARIKSVNDSMELFQTIQGLPRSMIDAGKFMDLMCRKGQVSADWVERRRGERRILFAQERSKAAGHSVYEDPEGKETVLEDIKNTIVAGRKPSVWRKKRAPATMARQVTS